MSSKSSGTHPTFDEEFGSTEIFFGFVLWAVFATLIIVLSLLRQCLQERPVEERRVREIQELIKEGEFEWKPIAASSTADIEEDEMRTQCALCLENFKEADKVLKLPWYARALIRARHNTKCVAHTSPRSRYRVRSGHSYHTACVVKWFNCTTYQARSCPHCRQNPLVSDAEYAQTDEERAEAIALQRQVPPTMLAAETSIDYWPVYFNSLPSTQTSTSALTWGWRSHGPGSMAMF